MYYTHCAEQPVTSITMLEPIYVTKTFSYYTYDHCSGEFQKSCFFVKFRKKN